MTRPDSPPSPPFLTADWRHLLMLNYEVEPDILGRYIPAGTELDTFDKMALVSIVGFRFLDTKLRGLAIPFHRDFDEVNLRFYVRRRAEDGWRRGVVFIKEIVPRPAITWAARRLYNENYVTLPMRHRVELGAGAAGAAGAASGSVAYSWLFAGSWNSIQASVAGAAADSEPGSEERFITEHHWGYTRQRDAGTLEYRVEHPRWRVWPAVDARLSCDVAELYGEQFVASLSGSPRSAFVADGSSVSVYRGERIPL